jgi:hypothetical protein
MTITIAPFTINTSCYCGICGSDREGGYLGNRIALQFGYEKEEQTKRNHLLITYWGIYLDDKYISYTSSRELAEKTKVWIEKWLKDRL